MATFSAGQFDVVLAHGPGCADGAAAAWIVYRNLPPDQQHALAQEGGFYSRLSSNPDLAEHINTPAGALELQSRGHRTVFAFIQPSTGVPKELVAGKRVLILDLDCGAALHEIVEAAESIVLIDHHASTGRTLSGEDCSKMAIYYDTRKCHSAASLTWLLFEGTPVPPLIEVVRIGDTWSWEDRPDLSPQQTLAALYNANFTNSFQDLEEVYTTWYDRVSDYIHDGALLVKQKKRLAKDMAKTACLGYLRDRQGKVYTIAYAMAPVLHSEVGAAIRPYAERRFNAVLDCTATWKYVPHLDLVQVSLRSPRPGLDLSILARNIDAGGKGGGHPEAAGFTFKGIANFKSFLRDSPPASSPPILVRATTQIISNR